METPGALNGFKITSGYSKSEFPYGSVATSITSFQIKAGTVPPVIPPIFELSSLPTQTPVTTSGVNPIKYASLLSSVVPVLPAAGLPILAARPVPFVITVFIIAVIVAAVFIFNTLLVRAFFASYKTVPLEDSTLSIAKGSTLKPPFAKTPYALVISKSLTLFEPREIV